MNRRTFAQFPIGCALLICATSCTPRSDQAISAANQDVRSTTGPVTTAESATLPRAVEYDAELLKVADEYSSWSRAGQLNWSPLDCDVPTSIQIVPARSDAPPGSPHGRKLYWLHPSDVNWYVDLTLDYDRPESWSDRRFVVEGGLENPSRYWGRAVAGPPLSFARTQRSEPNSGLTIVKATFEPEEVDPDGSNADGAIPSQGRLDGPVRHWTPGDPSSLFIMRYVGLGKPHSDAGWIYATIEPSTKDITASGSIASCIECHSKAPHGRLFGLRESPGGWLSPAVIVTQPPRPPGK